MHLSAHAVGTQTATVTTEHTLTSPGVIGRFLLIVDTVNMAAGDVLELRAKQVILTGGTLRVVDFAAFYGAQPADDLIKSLEIVSNELVEANAVRFTLKQTFGTGRDFPWKVLNLATDGLSTQDKADVNAQVLDVLNVDTFAQPGQENPAATTTLAKMIAYLYKFLRNKITQTSTTLSVYDDAGTTVDQKSTVSDDGTTYTRGEIGTGP